jgi:hypothetical protein
MTVTHAIEHDGTVEPDTAAGSPAPDVQAAPYATVGSQAGPHAATETGAGPYATVGNQAGPHAAPEAGAGPYAAVSSQAGPYTAMGAGTGAAGHPVYLTAPPNRLSRFVLRVSARSPRWAAPAAIAACFVGAASYVWVMNPTDLAADAVPSCVVKLTTGLDCPGCGGTRAFWYLMHGNLPEAVRHHAMAVFAAPFLVWLYVAWAVRRVSGRALPVPTVSAKTISIFLAAWMVFMVLRNLPFAPFTSFYV